MCHAGGHNNSELTTMIYNAKGGDSRLYMKQKKAHQLTQLLKTRFVTNNKKHFFNDGPIAKIPEK